MHLRKSTTDRSIPLGRHASASASGFARLLLFSTLIGLLACGGGSSQERLHEEVAELRSEVLALRQVKHEMTSLRSDVAEIRARLANPESDSSQKSSSAIAEKLWVPDGSHLDDPFLGPSEAGVVVMAFSDYQCRPCREFFQGTFDKLADEFIDSGKLRFIYRDFPLQGNKFSVEAATFAHCTGEQGKYWQAHTLLYENQPRVIAGEFSDLEQELSEVDTERLKKCRGGTVYRKEIAADIEEGIRLGAQGAPAFFIGKQIAKDSSSDPQYQGVFIRGAQPYPLIRSEVLKLLTDSSE